MLVTTNTPKTKAELVKTLNTLQNPKIDCFDVSNASDKRLVEGKLGELMRRGKVSVVLLSR